MPLGSWAARWSGKNARAHAKVDALEPAPRAGRVLSPLRHIDEKPWRKVPGYERLVARLLKGAKPELVSLDDLVTPQRTVNPDQVHHYVDVPAGDLKPATVVVVDGQKVIYDGNHRATADWAKGRDDVEARVVDLDAERDGDRSPSR